MDPHHRVTATTSDLNFQLLEVTIISAQDLHRAMTHTYTTVWVNPTEKVRTRIDPVGAGDPTWNDRFVFRVDSKFIKSETSAITVEIWASRRSCSDMLLGTVHINVSAALTTRLAALLVRRPKTLRPQGILNVGVVLLDPCLTSVPMLYSALGHGAWAHKDLIEDPGMLQASPAKSDKVEEKLQASPAKLDKVKEKLTLERCKSVEIGGWVVEEEMKTLESKLEKWRIELPPAVASSASIGKKRSRRSLSCCFCGGNE